MNKPMEKKFTYYLAGLAAGALICSSICGIGFSFYKQRAGIKKLLLSRSLDSFKSKIPGLSRKQIAPAGTAAAMPSAGNSGAIKITVDPARELGKISPLLYGSNLSCKMESEPDIIQFAQKMGISAFRFTGGGSPGYHWETGTFDFDQRCATAPLRDIKYVIEFCKRINAKLIIQVNIESGTAQEAAKWVEFMNKRVGFYVKYWELGNEVYGDWDKGYMPAEKYAELINEYAAEMKKADPTIKIGANWAPRQEDFNISVIKNAGRSIDFLSCHWYPNHVNSSHVFEGRIHPTPEEVMGNYLQIPVIINNANDLISRHAPQRKDKIEIAFLEWDGAWDGPNSDAPPYSQGIAQWSLANAIFHAECLGQFAKNHVSASAHFDFQSINYGLIRGWDRNAGWGGQRWDGEIIRPKAFATQMFSRYFGDILIDNIIENSPYYFKKQDWWSGSYSGNVPYISCYSSKFSAKKRIALVLINKSGTDAYNLDLTVKSIKPKEEGKIYVLTGPDLTSQNEGDPSKVRIKKFLVKNIKNEFTYKIPAHSVNLLEIDYE